MDASSRRDDDWPGRPRVSPVVLRRALVAWFCVLALAVAAIETMGRVWPPPGSSAAPEVGPVLELMLSLAVFATARAVVWSLWLLFGLALVRWFHRSPRPWSWRAAVVPCAALWLPVAALHTGLVLLLFAGLPMLARGIYPLGFDPYTKIAVFHRFVDGLGSYAIVAGFAMALFYFAGVREHAQRLRDLDAALDRAQLDALQKRLEPHFLFNVLNGIVVLVRKGDRDRAADMLTRLAELLRSMLEDPLGKSVTLADELRFIERYIELEKLRLGDRLRFEPEIHGDVLDAEVPHLVLLPLVENAIVHAAPATASPLHLRVRAEVVEDQLVLAVEDDGPGLPDDVRERVGIGNTRRRLEHLAGRLELTNRAPRGTRATVTLRLDRRESA